MEENLYVSLKIIEEIAKKNYVNYQSRTYFTDILKQLMHTSYVSRTPSKFRSATHFLSPEEFREHIYSSNVSINPILENVDPFLIKENNLFQPQRDVFTMVHLPYINADIHVHDYFELNYVYSGSCSQIFSDEKRQFFQGDLILIAPNSPHCVLVDEESLIISINIRQSTFNQTFWQLLRSNDMLSAFFQHALFDKNSCNYITFHLQNPQVHEALIQQIFDESTSTEEYGNHICINLMNIFFAQLLRKFGNTIHIYDVNNTTTFNHEFPMIMKYVQYNYATVTLPILSQVFHYSEVYISKMFKKNLKQNFSLVLQNLKMAHAKDYLENTNYKISEIAQLVGYDSVDYLSRIFKKYYGMTPSDYRKCQE